jgi:hypothetical protein
MMGSVVLSLFLTALTPLQAGVGDSTLQVTVLDSAGAVIESARVRIGSIELETNNRGAARFTKLTPGQYRVQVSAEGFESAELEVAIKPGSNSLEARLEVARVREELPVKPDRRESLTDPRGTAFTTILTEAQIALLPDDPDEFEAVLRQMAGPGAVIRVNGFTGGRLPPKSQIREIRFRLNPYAAENHNAGIVGVDIYTKPGGDTWHGTLNFGFRDEALAARNAFAPVRGPESYRRFGVALDGPLWKSRTSLFLSAEGSLAFDSKTIVAVLPEGGFFDLVQRPSRSLNTSVRIEHILTKSHTLRFEHQRNATRQNNLGVGDYDLPERAHSNDHVEQLLRFSDTGLIGSRLFNELRLQLRWHRANQESATRAPAVIVLNAFSIGGAQVQSDRRLWELELADNVDFAFERHALRSGILLESGFYETRELRNSDGTFIFSSLDAFRAALPTTFTRRSGDPLTRFSHHQFAWFLQDDIRVRQDLSISLGVRHEFQTHLDDHNNFAPRFGLAWSPFRDGATTIRLGGGIFYQWFGAETFEQSLRVDGRRQTDFVIRNPGFPDPLSAGIGIILPPSRIQRADDVQMARLEQVSVGVERQLANKFQMRLTYNRQRGLHVLRGRNINAPMLGGARPDPDSGNVTQVESTANSTLNLLNVNVSPGARLGRFYWLINYTVSEATNETDGPFSLPADNFNLRAERGPALWNARHRFFAITNLRLPWDLRLGTILHANSGTPYNITTGRDDNGDSVSNDRPPGVGRNSATGTPQWDVGTRLSWGFGFGGKLKSGGQSGRPTVVRSRGDTDTLGALASATANDRRFRLQVYIQVFNLLNHVNATNFSGVQTSPFFGQPTAALPGRRVETGMRFGF